MSVEGAPTSSARSASRSPPCTAPCRTGPGPTCRFRRWPKPNASRTLWGLNLRHTTGVIQALGTNGPLRFSHIAEEIGVDRPAARQRLLRMQADGLVGRAGSHHGAPYVLTDAGQSLGAVYATIEHWSEPFTALKTSSSPARVVAATRTHTNVPLTGDGARTAAALRRSTAAPNDLFSHATQPQPRVSAAVTARSAPGRGR
ncbi:winged helix-turn-helix transcriptional regulator [Streptomyces rubiginosohelvolus]|uniref:winged helix-turn-helix transcriptional regulator n=1 Tax=Streptomyces rubiginosohelvolus TaxID=67362 RepID=UPI003711BC37